MDDPLSALSGALEPLFEIEVLRQGKYSYAPVQELREALDDYTEGRQPNLNRLIKAVRDAKDFIERREIPIQDVTVCLDGLLKQQGTSPLNWESIFGKIQRGSHFQFSSHSPAQDKFIPWFSTDFQALTPEEKAQYLVEHRSIKGFSQQLTHHLKQYPDFLEDLIKYSEKNFTTIVATKIIFHLTYEQIARAIVQYAPLWHTDSANTLVQMIDERLSNGLTVKTLFRNKPSASILAEGSPLLKSYFVEKEEPILDEIMTEAEDNENETVINLKI